MKVFKSEIFKNVSVLSTGTVLAQIIPLICAPIIARLYDANDFGVFAAVVAIINVFSVVINGRYELAVVLPKEDSKAKSMLFGSWVIGVVLSAVILILLFPFFEFLSNYFGVLFGLHEAVVVALSLVCVAIWQPINYYFIRKKAFVKMTLNKFVKSTTTVGATIVVGYFFADLYEINGLTVGLFLGWVLLAVFSLFQCGDLNFNDFSNQISKSKTVLLDYIDYPKFNAAPAILNSIASQVGVYVFVFYYSTEIAGYYTFSKQYLFVPLSILGLSLSQVYFQRISEKFNRKESIYKELKILTLLLITVGVLMIVIVVLFSVPLFKFVFGEQWVQSAEMSRLLIIAFSVQFIVSPLSTVLHALKRVKLASVFPVIYMGSMLSLFLRGNLSLDSFLPFYVIAETVPYFAYLLIIFIAVNQYEKALMNN